MYTGGSQKPKNRKAERVDRRLAEEQTGKRQVVVVIREVRGRTLPFVVPRESAAVPLIRQHVASGTIVMADEAAGWDMLHGSFDTRRVNHSVEYVAADGANVNQAENLLLEAKGPMTTREVGRHIMVERGLNTADDAIVKTYTRRAGALLRHYRERADGALDQRPARYSLIYGRSQFRVSTINCRSCTPPSCCWPVSEIVLKRIFRM